MTLNTCGPELSDRPLSSPNNADQIPKDELTAELHAIKVRVNAVRFISNNDFLAAKMEIDTLFCQFIHDLDGMLTKRGTTLREVSAEQLKDSISRMTKSEIASFQHGFY